MEMDRIPGSAILPRLRCKDGRFPKVSSLSMARTLPASSIIALHNNSSEPQAEKRMFILGMGFVGQFLSYKLQNLGWAVSGTSTSHMKKKELEDRGFHIYHLDALEPELGILDHMKRYTHLLVSIPPIVGIGDPMLQHERLLRSSLVNGNLRWLCYLSSTSVYGDCDGELVDEDYPPNPTSVSAELRLASEEGWSNLAHYLGISPYIFRLGGIYGPGRSAIETIIKQDPLSEAQQRRTYRKYTSRVHVEDICQAIVAAAQAHSLGFREVYNIVDDDPAPREQVFEYARKLVGDKWPGLITQAAQEVEWSNAKPRNTRGEKRVSNARMKQELGVRLLYPRYTTGLQSILDNMDTPHVLC